MTGYDSSFNIMKFGENWRRRFKIKEQYFETDIVVNMTKILRLGFHMVVQLHKVFFGGLIVYRFANFLPEIVTARNYEKWLSCVEGISEDKVPFLRHAVENCQVPCLSDYKV